MSFSFAAPTDETPIHAVVRRLAGKGWGRVPAGDSRTPSSPLRPPQRFPALLLALSRSAKLSRAESQRLTARARLRQTTAHAPKNARATEASAMIPSFSMLHLLTAPSGSLGPPICCA